MDMANVFPKPIKPRRWYEFWLAKPKHYVLDAETGRFFDPGDPGFMPWLFGELRKHPFLVAVLAGQLLLLAYIVFG